MTTSWKEVLETSEELDIPDDPACSCLNTNNFGVLVEETTDEIPDTITATSEAVEIVN